MPVESAADRAVFFNPDEFGEPIRYGYRQEAPIDAVALWTRPTGLASFANTDVNLDVHSFVVDRAAIPAPRQGGVITVVATDQQLTIIRDPQQSADGALWTLSAAYRGG